MSSISAKHIQDYLQNLLFGMGMTVFIVTSSIFCLLSYQNLKSQQIETNSVHVDSLTKVIEQNITSSYGEDFLIERLLFSLTANKDLLSIQLVDSQKKHYTRGMRGRSKWIFLIFLIF